LTATRGLAVPLDRQDIEKRDFPIGRRGYEPEAVDAHLRRVAEEVDRLRRSSGMRTQPTSLAAAASEQVRTILEAAEASAHDLTTEAEQEARRIRGEAQADAERARGDAAAQAGEHVERVSAATRAMLQRLEAMENETATVIESLRTGANRLTADLSLLQGQVSEVGETVAPGRAASAARAPAEATAPAEVPAEAMLVTEVEPELGEPGEEEPLDAVEPAPDAVPEEPPAGSDDAEGARLIALNMALNGTPREEADRYLAENFQLDDRAGLLDDVYARVQ
jgi:DivIVA domain-containing protein